MCERGLTPVWIASASEALRRREGASTSTGCVAMVVLWSSQRPRVSCRGNESAGVSKQERKGRRDRVRGNGSRVAARAAVHWPTYRRRTTPCSFAILPQLPAAVPLFTVLSSTLILLLAANTMIGTLRCCSLSCCTTGMFLFRTNWYSKNTDTVNAAY